MRRQRESGFALLMVFLMAASIAIMMYAQLPRAAFESQRAKEELLMDRGEQYIRAIQLYVTKWKNYPPSIDVLENTNNVRYLRKRYKDPMTGKDEWRAVHVDGAGMLTDSLVQKQGKGPNDKKEPTPQYISVLPTVGAAQQAGAEAQNIALRRRPSDQGPAPGTGAPVGDPQSAGNDPQVNMATGADANAWNPQQQAQNQHPDGQQPQLGPDGQPVQQPQQPQQVGPDGQPIQQPNQQQQIGPDGQPIQNAGQVPPSSPGQPGQPPQFPQGAPGQMRPNQQNQNVSNSFAPNPYAQTQRPGLNPAYPQNVPVTPGMPGAQNNNPAQPAAGGTPNAGLNMINQILTTPRSNVNMNVPGVNGLQVGGGIAGFASKFEGPSIKVYNERQKYQEWEFIYDMKKDKRVTGQLGQMMGNQQTGNPLGSSPAGSAPTGSTPNPLSNQNSNPIFNPAGSSSGTQTRPGATGGFNQTGPQAPTYPRPGTR